MAFPQTPLDIKADLKIDGVWTDVTADVFTRDLMTITRGRPDEGARTDPGKCTLTFNNGRSKVAPTVNGRYSPDNPNSDLFEKIGRNTPVRVHVPAAEAYLELDGSAGGYVSTPDHASLDITGDIDVRVEFDADITLSTVQQALIGKWGNVAADRSWMLRIYNGLIFFHWLDATATPLSAFRTVQSYGGRALRFTLDVDNGAGGVTVRFYQADSIDGPWTATGDDLVFPGVTTSIQATNSDLRIGPSDSTTAPPRVPFIGSGTRFQVRSGIDGTLVADADFRPLADGAAGFTDSTGRVWTVNGTAKVRKRADRFNGEISAWPSRWDVSGKDVWVPVEAAGVLRRYGQGGTVLQSSLRRRVPSYSPLAYWPLEEGAQATQASSPVAGVRPLQLTRVNWAGADTLPSSAPLPVLASAGGALATLKGVVPAPTVATTGWNVTWLYRLDTAPTTLRTFMRVLTTGTVRQWSVQSRNNQSRVIGLDDDGNTVVDTTIGTGADLFNQWTSTTLRTSQSGSTVTWTILWQDVGGDAGQVTDTYTGTAGNVTSLASPTGGYTSDLDGLALGHIAVFSTETTDAYLGAITAWQGDQAGERMMRLASEENIPLGVRGIIADQEAMGIQRMTPLLDLLEECADSDGGILMEHRARPALRYRGRTTLYNQQPALTLNYSANGEIAPPLEPAPDDADVVNDVTVQRIDGSSGRAVLTEGALSVQAPPNGIGTGYDTSVQLSLDNDDQTEPIAYWRLHLGTWDAPRYPVVHVNLAAAPHLIDTVLDVDQGSLIRLTDLPAWLPPGDADLIVQGYTESFDQHAWDIYFTCTPAGPWYVGVVGDGILGRTDADPGTSALAAAATTSDPQLLVHTPSIGAEPPVPWITSIDRLSANPDFEADLAGWTGSGAAIARVATPRPAPFGGDWSLQITPNGVASLAFAASPASPVVPGTTYYPYGWLRCAVARSVDLNVNWYDSGGAYLTTSTVNHTVAAAEWTEFTGPVTAPVGAASARVLPTLASTPPASHVLLADVVLLGNGTADSYANNFPYDIQFGGETARVSANTPAVLDTFARTVASGWGTADSGGAWTITGTAADYSVGSGVGAVAQPAVGIAHLTLTPAPSADVDLYADLATSVLAAGSSLFSGLLVRAASNNDHYMARLDFTTGAGIVLTIRKRVAGVETQLGAFTTSLTHTAGTFYRLRLRAQGSQLSAKVWPVTVAEPLGWQVNVTDTSQTAAANLGTRSFANTGSTAVGVQMRFDNLRLVTPQRMTVQRSLNGITKAHTTGSEVLIVQPARVAL